MAKGSEREKERKRKKGAPKLTAKTADRHVLYQVAVQAPDFEVELLDSHFRRRVGRKPVSLREDFCGTALLCSEWVKSDEARTATGIDIDEAVLAWGREHNLAPLGEAASRVTLIRGDVRERRPDKHDVVCAFNYSYWYFKDRATLRGYFEAVKSALAPDGLFFLDLFGGYEAVQVLEESRKYPGFRYYWDQAAFNPITHDFLAHIHFRFKDGSKMKRAFTYDWRMWTIPELKDLLAEAGYTHVECLWEEEDEDGEGTGVFRPRRKVTNDPAYNAYLVAGLSEPIVRETKKEKKEKKDQA